VTLSGGCGRQAPDPKSEEASPFVKKLFNPVLELTHNHGTETQDDFAHKTGNEPEAKGFGHIGFLVEVRVGGWEDARFGGGGGSGREAM